MIVNASAAASEISTRKLGGNYGLGIIHVDNTVGGQGSVLQWATFNDTNAGSTYDFQGAFGTATNMIRFGSGGTFAHAAPTSRTSATGIIPRAIVNGNEWATYDSSSASAVGLRAYTGYSSATNILSASATAVFKATGANSLSGNQTLLALNLNTDSGIPSVSGLGGLNPSSLTLTTGAVLVNGSGSTATLTVPLVTLGAEGCDVWAQGRCQHVPGVVAEQVIDPTGCGDAFRGALLYGLERGWPLTRCVELGNRVGALKIACRGGQNHSLTDAVRASLQG